MITLQNVIIHLMDKNKYLIKKNKRKEKKYISMEMKLLNIEVKWNLFKFQTKIIYSYSLIKSQKSSLFIKCIRFQAMAKQPIFHSSNKLL